MFDVIWTDPGRELVGEHRARKELEKEKKSSSQKDSNSSNSRSSISTRSSSSSGEKSFRLFGTKGLKRTLTPSRGKSSSSGLLNFPQDSKSRRQSVCSTFQVSKPHELHDDTSTTLSISERQTFSDRFPDTYGNSFSSRDSVFSRVTDKTSATVTSNSGTYLSESTTKSSLVQSIGPESFVTKYTEVTVAPREASETDQTLVSKICITSAGRPITPPLSPQPINHAELPFSPMSSRSAVSVATSSSQLDSPVKLLSGSSSTSSGITKPAPVAWAAKFKPNNPDAWRPPDEWDCSAPPEMRSPVEGILGDNIEPHAGPFATGIDDIQREARTMKMASAEVILYRLKQQWEGSQDACVYRELEMEKKRWMLSALYNMDGVVDWGAVPRLDGPLAPALRIQRILALYETSATASYLAALHSDKMVYHMSKTPLNHRLFPNIHPVLLPGISPSSFPVAPSIFSAVYSLSMPVLLPSPDMPRVLKNIHRCLVPGGTFYLTLVDPMPSAMNLGPKMRMWLEEKLMFNLEMNFRCTMPSKLFPLWLANAGLRAEGSTITTAKFLAAPPNQGSMVVDMSDYESNIKVDLRSTVGRMLWTEVWGSYVQAEKWWWEDAECMEECANLGTFWEYYLIEAVKE